MWQREMRVRQGGCRDILCSVQSRKLVTRRWLRNALGAIAGAWLLSLGAVVLWGQRDNAARSDVIVVLGAAQYDGRPSPVLRSRLDHALGLWRQGMAKRVILTGGRGQGDTTSEAAVGHLYLKRRGIPESWLLVEDQSRNTEQSIAAVAVLMRRQQMEDAILVSDPFHMLRLRLLAWHHGLNVRTSPTRTSPISANKVQVASYMVSESVKVPLSLVLVALRSEEGE